jgi:hypothetical protein
MGKECKKLESLGAGRNLTDKDVRAIVALVGRKGKGAKLKHISIGGGNLSDAGVKGIVDQWSTSLLSVELRGRRITDTGLAHMLKTCCTLQKLKLDECNGASLQSVAAAQGPWRDQLHTLIVLSCKSITVRSVGTFLEACCPSLRVFHLGGHSSGGVTSTTEQGGSGQGQHSSLGRDALSLSEGLWALHELRLTGTGTDVGSGMGQGLSAVELDIVLGKGCLRSLRVLDLSDSVHFGQQHLALLDTACCDGVLRHLMLNGCSAVNDRGLQYVVAQPQLRALEFLRYSIQHASCITLIHHAYIMHHTKLSSSSGVRS